MSTHAAATSSGDAVSDGELGADILFGLLIGTPLTYAVVLVVCILAGIGMGNSLAVAILPCALSGVFFGGVIPLSRQMARHEAAERAGRSVLAVIDGAAVLPAA